MCLLQLLANLTVLAGLVSAFALVWYFGWMWSPITLLGGLVIFCLSVVAGAAISGDSTVVHD